MCGIITKQYKTFRHKTLKNKFYFESPVKQAEQAESDSNRQVTVEDAIRTGAFVVAMSLWHNHSQKTKQPSMNEAVKQIEQEVLTTWPAEAISHAENVVYRLSGMYGFVVNDAPDQAEDSGPAEPVSAGKCSTVS